VIGGAGLFLEALPLAGRIYLTRVHGNPLGDVYWDLPAPEAWRVVSHLAYDASPADDYPVTHFVLEREKASTPPLQPS
jgi:dihydrofolate reductase